MGIVPIGTQVNMFIINSPLITKPNLEQFWNLELPSTCDEDLYLHTLTNQWNLLRADTW